jgi:peptidyl-prolyl cis-trans isomerase C
MITVVGIALVLAACSGGGSAETSLNSGTTTSTAATAQGVQSLTHNTTDEAAPELNATEAGAESGGTQPAVSNPLNLPINEAGQPLVARVNGQDITHEAFQREVARREREGTASDPDALAATVLDTMIEQAVIEQQATAMQITISETDLDEEITDQRAIVEDRGDSWQAWLDRLLYTEDEYRDAQRSARLTAAVVQAVTMTEPVQVTQVHARHILVATEDEANSVIQRLQNGEDFEALAAEVSQDVTTRYAGGDLGWFIREDLTTPELADLALSLEPGQIAGPISTVLGFHIIQTIEIGQRAAEPEEQAQMAEARFNAWLSAQTEASEIERFLAQ